MARRDWSTAFGSAHQSKLKIHDSLKRHEVDFVPIQEGHVTWYSCGPTVYDDSHLGHARNYVTTDIIRRILREYFGFKVRFVMNITDVDDKIILRFRQRHFYEQYQAEHRYIDEAVRADVKKAWLEYIEKHLPRIPLKPPPEPQNFDSTVEKYYGDTIRGVPGGRPTDDEAKIAMHIKTSRSTRKALTEDPKMLTPHEFYSLANDPMCQMLDKELKTTIKGDDHDIFTKSTKEYEDRFFKDMHDLNVEDPDELVRVTEHGPQIADFVKQIEDNGYAYRTQDGSVYFDINAFEKAGYQYARLQPESKNNKALQEEGEGSLSKNHGGKRSGGDFALWKASKEGEPSWRSDWGLGRPGWHIECSAMASARLGRQMDIHSGGIDLAFPHHDNELAQSEAYWHGNPEVDRWVRYFLHMGHLSIQGSKMSKSLKNFTTIREALHVRKEWTSRSLRIVFLLGEWRRGIEITDDMVQEGRSWEDRVDNFFLNVKDGLENVKDRSAEPTVMAKPLQQVQEEVLTALLKTFATRDVMYALIKLITFYNSADKTNFTLGDHEAPGIYVTQIVNIFGLNGTATKEDAMEQIGWSGLQISGEAEMYVRPLASARDQLRQAAIARLITTEKVRDIVNTIPAYPGVINGRPQRPSYARALSDFRDNILTTAERSQPETSDLNKQVLALCDKVRDVDLWQLDIYLEDREDRPARVRPVTEGLRAARKEKEERTRQKEELRLKKKLDDEARLREGMMPPSGMYKPPYSEEYSQWATDGVPTHAKDGSKVTDSRMKKLKKDMAQQQKKHDRYLEAVKKGTVKP